MHPNWSFNQLALVCQMLQKGLSFSHSRLFIWFWIINRNSPILYAIMSYRCDIDSSPFLNWLKGGSFASKLCRMNFGEREANRTNALLNALAAWIFKSSCRIIWRGLSALLSLFLCLSVYFSLYPSIYSFLYSPSYLIYQFSLILKRRKIFVSII